MTVQIRKSLLVSTDLFDIEVAAFAKEQRDWLEREVKVKEEEGKDIAPIDRHHRYPAPSAHPLIVSAVNLETGLPDYEFLDDLPTPTELLDQKKKKLVDDLAQAELAAIAAVMSPAKRRLADMKLSDISRADSDRHKKVHLKYVGLLQKLKLKDIDHKAMADEVAGMRSDDDNKFLADMTEKRNVIEAINRKVIEAHAAIEDLTAETVDAYQLPKL